MNVTRRGRGADASFRSIGARAAVLVVSAIVAACGGGGGGSEVQAPEPAAPVPTACLPEVDGEILLCNDGSAVVLEGNFEIVDGYQSKSAQVLQSSGSEPASARFEPGVAERGHYEVKLWWPQGAPAGSAAEVLVEHLGGSTAVVVDQAVGGGEWYPLGTFEFGPAQPGAVILRKVGGAPLIVDAVGLRFVGDVPPAFATSALPIADVGQPYAGKLEVSGGLAPYTFTVAAGTLPPGLQLDAGSGAIAGTPTTAGDYALGFEATDSGGARASVALTIVVEPASGGEPQEPPAPGEEPPPVSGEEPPPSGGEDPPPGDTAGLEDPAAPGNLSGLRSIVAAMPEGGWRKVNLNLFSDAWAPAALRPLYGSGNPEPRKIIAAWSSFAWDPNRGNLLIYGGGHANYRGNEVYVWRGTTRKWTRGSLPSEVKRIGAGSWNPVDGADRAPASAHTYDNNVFLPILDRFLTFGGAAEWEGSQYKVAVGSGTRNTGPYLFDPSRAHPNRVGGSTGSHVQRVAPHPEIVGGNMWSNRENYLNASKPPSNSFADGCTAYAQENGRDVVYVYTKWGALYRYTIHSLADRTLDTWEKVGRYWNGPGSKTVCAYDPARRVFVRTGTNTWPFVYWDLAAAGADNLDVRFVPSDPSGQFAALMQSTREIRDCGLDFDRTRGRFALWCGGGTVWMLTPPAALSPNGWTVQRQPAPGGSMPGTGIGTGILGKWKYIPNLDAFIALQGSVEGNVWVYKPVGWQAP